MSSTLTTQQGRAHSDESFKARINALLAFMKEHGTRPQRRSIDPAERTLTNWFTQQRSLASKGGVAPERAQLLAEAEKVWLQLPGNTPMVRSQGGLSGYTRRVVAIHEKHGRLPDWKAPDEYADYQALRFVRRYYRHGTLSPAEIKVLRKIPGALKVTRKDPLPRLAELQAWCAAHERLPRHDIRGKITADEEIEAGLGQWLYRHVNRRHEPLETAGTTFIRDSIIALKDEYPASGAVIEEVRAAAVVDFIEKNGRMPRVRREHQLYEHAYAIRTRYRHGGAYRPATVRMLELTRDLPNHLESQWDGDFDRLAEFVTSHGRLPAAEKNPGRGRPTLEYQITRWLAQETGEEATSKDPSRQAKLAALISSVELPVAA